MKKLLAWAEGTKEAFQETHKMDAEEGQGTYTKEDIDLIYDEFIAIIKVRIECVQVVYPNPEKRNN